MPRQPETRAEVHEAFRGYVVQIEDTETGDGISAFSDEEAVWFLGEMVALADERHTD